MVGFDVKNDVTPKQTLKPDSTPTIRQLKETVAASTVAGSYNVEQLSLNDLMGVIRVHELQIISAPVITTSALSAMEVGAAFSQQLAATSTSVVWSVVDGELPAGLTLSASGLLDGEPEEDGAYDFTVRAENGSGHDDKTFTGTVAA